MIKTLRRSLPEKICKLFALAAFALCITAFAGCADDGVPVEPENSKAENQISSKVFTDNEDGTISFSYNNTNKEKCKVVVQLSGQGQKMYQYDIPQGQVNLTLPLTQGNGTYKIYLCRQTKDNKYSVMENVSVTLNLEDDNVAFLGSSVIVDWDTTNAAIKEAQVLTAGLDSDEDKLKAIYNYVVENYTYDYDKMNNIDELTENMAYIPDIDDTYDTHTGICYDISVMVASMLRSVNIPAKVVTGYTNTTLAYHAWNNVFIPKEWKVMDVTYDIQVYQKNNRRVSMFKKSDDYFKTVYTY